MTKSEGESKIAGGHSRLTSTQSFGRKGGACDEAERLAKEGRPGTEISKETGTSDATVRGWLVNGRKPWTRYELFKPRYSDQLTYVIGVYMGDGSISRWRNRFSLRLGVKDKEFADKFSSTCAQVLGKKPYSVRHVRDRDTYETIISTRLSASSSSKASPTWIGMYGSIPLALLEV